MVSIVVDAMAEESSPSGSDVAVMAESEGEDGGRRVDASPLFESSPDMIRWMQKKTLQGTLVG